MYIITKQHPVATFKKCNTKNWTDTHDHSADRLKAIKSVHLVQRTTITSNKIKHTTKHKTVIFMTKYKTKIPQNVRTICINFEYTQLTTIPVHVLNSTTRPLKTSQCYHFIKKNFKLEKYVISSFC